MKLLHNVLRILISDDEQSMHFYNRNDVLDVSLNSPIPFNHIGKHLFYFILLLLIHYLKNKIKKFDSVSEMSRYNFALSCLKKFF